jgi:hypothetical protein
MGSCRGVVMEGKKRPPRDDWGWAGFLTSAARRAWHRLDPIRRGEHFQARR